MTRDISDSKLDYNKRTHTRARTHTDTHSLTLQIAPLAIDAASPPDDPPAYHKNCNPHDDEPARRDRVAVIRFAVIRVAIVVTGFPHKRVYHCGIRVQGCTCKQQPEGPPHGSSCATLLVRVRGKLVEGDDSDDETAKGTENQEVKKHPPNINA